MKRRFSLLRGILPIFLVAFCCCVVLTCLSLGAQILLPPLEAEPDAPAQSTPSATEVPAAPTASPDVSDRIVDGINNLGTTFPARFLGIARAVGLVLGVLLAAYLLAWLIELIMRRQLVVPNFVNAAGADLTEQSLKTLSLLARSNLTAELQMLEPVVRRNIRHHTGQYQPREHLLPSETADNTLNQLITSLKDSASDPYKPVLNLIGVIFPARGISVNMTLLHKGFAPGKVGIACSLSDLAGNNSSRLFELWEPETPSRQSASAAVTGAEDPPHGSPQLTLSEVGTALSGAELYEDAISYFDEALRAKPDSKEIMNRRTEAQLGLQTSVRNEADFTLARQLVADKRPQEAIEYYINALNPSLHAKARELWNRVLVPSARGKRTGEAYLQLADLYREARCTDLALELYGEAIQRQAKEARPRRDQFLQDQAALLTHAARQLYHLGHFSSAEKYIGRSLEQFPDSPVALALHKAIRHNLPPEVDEEARASLLLGKLYASTGNLSKALSFFEASVNKEPDYQDAQDAIASALKALPPLDERYISLLGGVSRALALEITRHEIIESIQSRLVVPKRRLERASGEVCNFLAALYQPSALANRKFKPEFLKSAQGYLEEAVRKAPGDYLVYENWGDWSVLCGRDLLDQKDEERARKFFRQSVVQYQAALHYLEHPHPQLARYITREPEQRRITVSKAIALLLTEDQTRVDEAHASMKAVEADLAGRLHRETDSRLLYCLAVWYVESIREKDEITPKTCSSILKAKLCLAYCVARSAEAEYDHWVLRDPTLQLLRENMLDLVFQIHLLRIEDPDFYKPDSDTFRPQMKEVFGRSRWLTAKEKKDESKAA